MNPQRFRVVMVVGAIAATAAAAIAGSFSSKAGDQLDAEAAFRQARAYTVRIRTRVETPFLEDERGAWDGAGFLVDAERGWIVTNAHVAGHSPSEVQVAFAGQAFQPARKLYVDSFADIAILALDHPEPGRRPASLDRAAAPVVGEPVGAFGHPLGVPFTGSRGIVSGYTYQTGPDLIQIDATVDPGNSGGPVISLRDGGILGIATAHAGNDNKADRLNFATPIQDVRRILGLLRQGTSPCPPRLGFALLKDEDNRHTLRVACSFDTTRWPLRPGDRLVAIAGTRDTLERLHDLVGGLRGRPGSVALIVERAGRRVTLVTRPTMRPPVLERRGVSIDGALVAPIDYEDETDSPQRARLMVHSVEPASAAHTVGFAQMDILHTVDGRRYDDVDSLVAYLRRRPRGPIALVVRRVSDDLYRVFDHHLRELPGSDFHVVGPDAAPVVAAGGS
jgi:S1-C subfamily serine protease